MYHIVEQVFNPAQDFTIPNISVRIPLIPTGESSQFHSPGMDKQQGISTPFSQLF
jgi:hypothetical protein